MDHARANKIEQTILHALAETGQSVVAQQIQVNESTVSRAKADIQIIAKIMAACGLKVVPVSARCFNPKYIESLQHLAREHLNADGEIRTLDWD